ncbi:MAG TPA: glycosyltransferase [Candidatus Paceibacterota bacterium]|nr:glycosyltransferase [Candidatus Paceibacterota bacterium]
MGKKTILFLITKASWGGAQRYVYDLAMGLQNGFEITVAYGQEGLLTKKLAGAHIPTLGIQSLQRDVSILNDLKSFFELRRLFNTKKPDVVHLNSSKAAAIGALAARMSGVPRIIFTVHGWPFGEQRNAISRFLIYIISWFTAVLSHQVIVVCDYDLQIAKKMPFVGGKTVRIYNGIDLNLPLGSGEVIRGAFPQGVRITGTIGELTKNKNQIALIEQAAHDPAMFVAIVGDGEDRWYLKSEIEKYGLTERVKLFGFMEAAGVLRGFDTFALPSIKEGLPYVLLEARVAGLPIVANRVGGVGEILDAKDLQQFSLEQMVRKTAALY